MGTSGCRRCGECRGQAHHWCSEILTDDCLRLQCKHCPATADLCDECDGGGCTDCAGTGVFNVLEEAC